MLSAVALASLLLAAHPDAGAASGVDGGSLAALAASGIDVSKLPATSRAALAGMHIPGVTEPRVDPTAGLPPELVAPWQISMDFFSDVLRRDVDGAVAFSRAPFDFDGHVSASADDIKKGWTRYLDLPRNYHPTLYSLDIYPYDEMVKRYGPPPPKLSDVSFKGSLVAVANLDGHATLAVLRRDPSGVWRVYAFSD